MNLIVKQGFCWFGAGLFLLLSGCAGLSSPPAANPTPISSIEVSEEHRREADIIYLLLAGEMYGSRSQLPESAGFYLEAARLSLDPEVAKRAASIAAYARNPEATIRAAERWVELAPEDIDARQTLALLYINTNELDKALVQLEYLLSRAGDELDQEILKISFLLSKQSDTAQGLEVMQRLLKTYADNPYILFGKGHLAFQAGQMDVAKEDVEQALKLKPDLHDARALLARINMSLGNVPDSLALMEQLLKDNPDSRQYHIAYARLLTETRDYKAARRQFEKLLKKYPDDAEILYALALLSIEAEQLDLAEQFLLKVVKGGRNTDDAYYFLGGIAESRGEYDQAIQWFSRVQSGERKMSALITVAKLLGKKGEVSAARLYLQRLRDKNPELAVRLFIIEAEILKDADLQAEAMELLSGAIEASPEKNDLYYARSLVAEQLGQLELAEQDLRKVLETEPDNAHALNALGYMLADGTGRYQEALQYIERAFALSPEEPAIIDSMGWIHYRLNDFDKALEYLRRAYALDQDAEIAAHLGEVLWMKGERGEARKLWKLVLDQDPENRFIKKVLQRLGQ